MEKHSTYYKGSNNSTYTLLSCVKNLAYAIFLAVITYMALSNILELQAGNFCFLGQNCTAIERDVTNSSFTIKSSVDIATNRVNVLIFSLPRSGSSFLGELFNRENDILYLYEPLHAQDALQKLPVRHKRLTEDPTTNNALPTLKNLFTCNLLAENNLFQFLSYPELSNPHFRLMSNVLSSPPFCDYPISQNSTELEYRKHCLYINTTLLSLMCEDKKSVVVKDLLHRLPLYQPQVLKKLFELRNLRSIWLVRDPRAIISSMMTMGWLDSINTPFRNDNTFNVALKMSIRKVCHVYHTFLDTLSTVLSDSLRRNKLIIVRYEDLMSKPLSIVYQVLKFANVNVRIDTLNWVMENINGHVTTTNRPDESFSISGRNASYSLTSWRKMLRFHQVSSIQKHCAHVMKRLGYVLFLNESDMWNLNAPSIMETYDVRSLTNLEELLSQL